MRIAGRLLACAFQGFVQTVGISSSFVPVCHEGVMVEQGCRQIYFEWVGVKGDFVAPRFGVSDDLC